MQRQNQSQNSEAPQEQHHLSQQQSSIVNQLPIVGSQNLQQPSINFNQGLFEESENSNMQAQGLFETIEDDLDFSNELPEQNLEMDFEMPMDEVQFQQFDEDSVNEKYCWASVSSEHIEKKLLPLQVQKISQNIFKLKPLKNYLSIPQSKKVQKLICAKVIKSKDTVVECFDCGKDPSCIICLECFKNGNHQGHRYLVKSAFGGCCDCGDVQAWKEEGFCDNHSGKFNDFDVEQKDFMEFREKIQGLFYLYFWQRMRNKNTLEQYFKELMKYLKDLNTDNLYYNKLFALVLCQPLSKQYSLTPEMNKRTILENLLTYTITKNHFDQWFKLFIMIFSYYPFKSSILSHYMTNYGLIVDGSNESYHSARSIACQLLTSFKLVEHYALENKTGLGHDMKIPQAKQKLYNYFHTLSKDISNLANLPNEASLIYFRMHINSEIGLNNMLMYYDLLLKQVKFAFTTKTQALIIANFIDFPIIERQTIWNFVDILKNVKTQPELLAKIIKSLWQKCEKITAKQQKILCILRPYQRCLCLALFAYFDCSLQTIPHRKQALINEILSTTESKFESTCSSILQRFFYTLFFYSRTQAYPGLGQTCYNYNYYYKIGSKILSTTDLLSVKVLTLLLGKSPLLEFESIVGVCIGQLEKSEYRKDKIGYLVHVLEILRYLFLHNIPQIYITNGLNPKSDLYALQIKSLFVSIFKQHKNSISLQDLNTYLLNFIEFPQTKLAKQWLAEYCTFNKQNKMYSLRNIYQQEMLASDGINFDDLWLSQSSKDSFGDIKKSLNFVDEVNMKVFILLWGEENIAFLENLVISLMQFCECNEELRQIFNFLTLLYSINKAKNLNCKFDKKIIQNSKGIIPNSVLENLELTGGENIECQKNENERKQKAQEIKARKLLEMKKKRSNFLKTEDQLLNNSPQKVEQSYNSFENSCCICRSQINQSSVVLVNLEIRNHQKLLDLGSGIECLSLNTCRHVFDYECIMKKWKNNVLTANVFCPLCKFSSNLLFPVCFDFKKELADEIIYRMTKIMKSINSKISLFEELIKSFYHYFLLCKVDFGKSFEKKGLLYLTLYDIICKKIKGQELFQIESNFKEEKFISCLNVLQKQGKSQGSMMIYLMNILQKRVNQSISSQVVNTSDKPQEVENKVQENEKEQRRFSKYFHNVIFKIIESIKGKLVHQENQYDQQSRMEEEEGEQSSFLNIFMRTLTDKKLQLADLMQLLSQNHEMQNYHILKGLPLKYSQIVNKKCTECSQVSIGLVRCLLCNWQGCQECQDSKAICHIQKTHGTIGAVMNIQRTCAYYVCEQRKMLIGRLYESAWANKIQKNGDWQSFQLKSGLMEEIERRLLLDDLPTRVVNEQY